MNGGNDILFKGVFSVGRVFPNNMVKARPAKHRERKKCCVFVLIRPGSSITAK